MASSKRWVVLLLLATLLLFSFLERQLAKIPDFGVYSGPHLTSCEHKCLLDGAVCAGHEPDISFDIPFLFNYTLRTPAAPQVFEGTVLAWHCRSGNINHGWHDDYWAMYAWARRELASGATVVMRKSADCSPWLEQLFDLMAKQRGWRVVKQPTGWLCAQNKLLLAGRDRKLTFAHESIPEVAAEVRAALGHWKPIRENNSTRILIYTRMDSNWRHIEGDVDSLAALFRQHNDSSVEIVDRLPETLEQQAVLFSRVDMLVAPNGGWAPNVLLLPPSACVVELHQYTEDSWLKNFGLAAAIGDLITVTGDFHDPRKRKMPPRSGRRGGDDALVSNAKLWSAVERAVVKSPRCRHFLM